MTAERGGAAAQEPFALPLRAMALLAHCDRPWWLNGGWALDLFLGRVTRAHAGLDIAILCADLPAFLRCLVGWEIAQVVRRGGVKSIVPLDAAGLAQPFGFEWLVRRPGGDPPEFEAHLQDADGEHWRLGAAPGVTRPLALLGRRTALGTPYLCPEVVLLLKAPYSRAKDHEDFARAAPPLAAEPRAWLRESLVAYQPGHLWLARL